jgi:hypothetical protein
MKKGLNRSADFDGKKKSVEVNLSPGVGKLKAVD